MKTRLIPDDPVHGTGRSYSGLLRLAGALAKREGGGHLPARQPVTADHTKDRHP